MKIPVPPPTPAADLEAALAELGRGARAWVSTSVQDRIALLRRLERDLAAESEAWVRTSVANKGGGSGGSVEGQEWLVGFAPLPRAVRELIRTLRHDGTPPVRGIEESSDGRPIVRAFPQAWADRLLFRGWSLELWLERGSTPRQGGVYRDRRERRSSRPRVCLVLGAGNQAFLGPTDALHKLFVEDQVVLLKMNPVNAAEGPHLERAFRALIDPGFLRVAYGDAETGDFLCRHEVVDAIHLTGSRATYEAIVFGGDAGEREERKRRRERRIDKPFSAELGCVSPYLIVPGPWSGADVDYHARQVASAVAQNAGHNCVAAQILVLPSGWALRDRFAQRVEAALARIPPRPSFYPGAEARRERLLAGHRTARRFDADGVPRPWAVAYGLDPGADSPLFREEGFCGVLGVVDLPVSEPDEFLGRAVALCNERLWGNLSVTLAVHPRTERDLGDRFRRALRELRYGTIGVNVWAGVSCALMVSGWGAYPGNPPEDIQSGAGIVHDFALFEPLEKNVLRAPFRIRPDPPWLLDARSDVGAGRAFARYEMKPGVTRLARLATRLMF